MYIIQHFQSCLQPSSFLLSINVEKNCVEVKGDDYQVYKLFCESWTLFTGLNAIIQTIKVGIRSL